LTVSALLYVAIDWQQKRARDQQEHQSEKRIQDRADPYA
jgi:hypothetical protein